MISVYFLPTIDCQELINAIDKEARATPGCSLGCMRGSAWASLKLSAQEWNIPAVSQLDEYVRQAWGLAWGKFPDSRIDWWFTKLEPGGEILEHDHLDAVASGAFYPEHGNEFILEPQGAELLIGEGALTFFPANQKHRVPPVRRTRRSMAFNIYANHP